MHRVPGFSSQNLHRMLRLLQFFFNTLGFISQKCTAYLNKGKNIFRKGRQIGYGPGDGKIKGIPELRISSPILSPAVDRLDIVKRKGRDRLGKEGDTLLQGIQQGYGKMRTEDLKRNPRKARAGPHINKSDFPIIFRKKQFLQII